MHDVYATTMKLVHVGGGDAFEVACKRALVWAWRVDGDLPDLYSVPIGSRTDHANRTTVQWWASLDVHDARALEVRLRHPDTHDPAFHWQATVTISSLDAATRATVRLERGADVHIVRPARMSLSAPAIVKRLMEAPLSAYAGTLELIPGMRTLSSSDTDSFVSGVLLDAERALPVLVASSLMSSELAQELARRLAGLAQVVRLADQDAEVSLNSKLRRGRRVPSGGLRLYWPGFEVEGNGLRHPHWTPREIDRGTNGRRLGAQLIRMLADISTGRVPVDPGVMRARRAALAARWRERARRRPSSRVAPTSSAPASTAIKPPIDESRERLQATIDQLRERLARAERERDDAEARARRAEENEDRVIAEALEREQRHEQERERLVQLKSKVAALQWQLERKQGSDSGEDEEYSRDVPDRVTSWEEVREALPLLEGDGFCVTRRALACADGKGRYPYPDEMWQALLRLERVGRAYNGRGGAVGRRFEDFAADFGLKVALGDDSYVDYCWFRFEGRWYQRLPHVKIDDAVPESQVGRIYFALDSDNARVIVDWFGTKSDRPLTKRTA